jgi:hypothetical protein
MTAAVSRAAIVVVLAALALLAPVRAYAQAAGDRWTFSLMPYLWLPGMDGTLRYGPPASGGASPNVSVDADTLVGALDMAFMITGEARKGRWLIATDVIYLDLSSDSSSVNSIDFNPGSGPVNISNTALDAGTQTNLKGTVWTLVGGYAAVQDPRATLDVIGGFRYFGLKATSNWQLSATVAGPGGAQTFARTGSVTKSDDLWDAIVGVKGRVKLGDGNWFMPYYLDAGAGDSTLTWQGMLGVGHAFKWGEVVFAYRYLSYEQGGNKLIEDLSFGGFGLGVNFRF